MNAFHVKITTDIQAAAKGKDLADELVVDLIGCKIRYEAIAAGCLIL